MGCPLLHWETDRRIRQQITPDSWQVAQLPARREVQAAADLIALKFESPLAESGWYLAAVKLPISSKRGLWHPAAEAYTVWQVYKRKPTLDENRRPLGGDYTFQLPFGGSSLLPVSLISLKTKNRGEDVKSHLYHQHITHRTGQTSRPGRT